MLKHVNLGKHTSSIWAVMGSELVVLGFVSSLLKRERRVCSDFTPTQWVFKNPFWVGVGTKQRSCQPVHSPLADDLATAPSGPV